MKPENFVIQVGHSERSANDFCVLSLSEFLNYFQNCGSLAIGTGEGHGDNRALHSVKQAVDSFPKKSILAEKAEELISEVDGYVSESTGEIVLNEAKRVLVSMNGNASLKEVNLIMHYVADNIGEGTAVWYGTAANAENGDQLSVTIILSSK